LALDFFFFQAEDGIRDKLVTGVQTCALPIFNWAISRTCRQIRGRDYVVGLNDFRDGVADNSPTLHQLPRLAVRATLPMAATGVEIGRASCRERVWISVGGGSLKNKRQRQV